MTALVPALENEAAPLVSLATAELAAMIRLDGVDDRRRLLWYVIRLAGARADVHGRIIGALSDGKQIELGRLDVAPGAIGESRFAVVQPRGRAFAHIYLDLRSADLALRVEAPAAPLRRPARSMRIGAALVLAGLLVSAGVTIATLIPQPPAIAAPRAVPAGDPIRVGYAARSYGRLSFAVTADDGRPIAGAPLTASQDGFSVDLPRRLGARRIVVRIDSDGPFGRTSNTAAVAVVPPVALAPAAPAARIAAFAARREGGANDESVLASYLAVADSGVLVVSDGARRVLGTSPFSHGGTTRIALLPAARGQALTLRMDVRRGASRASAALGLAAPIAPPNTAPPLALQHADAPPTADDAPASAADDGVPPRADDAPFALSGRAVAGRAMTILVRRAMPSMRLRLADDTGTPLANVAVPPGAREVAITPPTAVVWRTYYLSCTYGSENAEETVVRTVRVAPR